MSIVKSNALYFAIWSDQHGKRYATGHTILHAIQSALFTIYDEKTA